MDSIGDLLRGVLPPGPPAADELTATCACWRTVAGDRARHAWPARITRDRVLVVNATSAVWAQELTMAAPDLLSELARGGCEFARLRVVVGPVPGAPMPVPEA